MKQIIPLKPLDRKPDHRKRVIAFISMMCVFALMTAVFPTAFADGVSAGEVISKIITLVKYICIVVGVLLTVMGIVKFILAHNEGDGPAQQKAGVTLAVGLVLIAVGATKFLDSIASWIPDLPSD